MAASRSSISIFSYLEYSGSSGVFSACVGFGGSILTGGLSLAVETFPLFATRTPESPPGKAGEPSGKTPCPRAISSSCVGVKLANLRSFCITSVTLSLGFILPSATILPLVVKSVPANIGISPVRAICAVRNLFACSSGVSFTNLFAAPITFSPT